MKTIRISQDFTFPEVPPLIWEVPPLIWEVPLLIWWVGGKMNPRIRLTSAKVGVEVEAELGNIKLNKI